jgi:hypothetical protein
MTRVRRRCRRAFSVLWKEERHDAEMMQTRGRDQPLVVRCYGCVCEGRGGHVIACPGCRGETEYRSHARQVPLPGMCPYSTNGPQRGLRRTLESWKDNNGDARLRVGTGGSGKVTYRELGRSTVSYPPPQLPNHALKDLQVADRQPSRTLSPESIGKPTFTSRRVKGSSHFPEPRGWGILPRLSYFPDRRLSRPSGCCHGRH